MKFSHDMINHLTGREFVHGSQDCYGLIRDFYIDIFNIQLPDYARPDNWWNQGMDLYRDHYIEEGFEVIHCHPKDWWIGDIILMAIFSPIPCHAGIYLGRNLMLHHFIGRRSNIEQYKGRWRTSTTGIYRHRDTHKLDPFVQQIDIHEALERVRNNGS